MQGFMMREYQERIDLVERMEFKNEEEELVYRLLKRYADKAIIAEKDEMSGSEKVKDEIIIPVVETKTEEQREERPKPKSFAQFKEEKRAREVKEREEQEGKVKCKTTKEETPKKLESYQVWDRVDEDNVELVEKMMSHTPAAQEKNDAKKLIVETVIIEEIEQNTGEEEEINFDLEEAAAIEELIEDGLDAWDEMIYERDEESKLEVKVDPNKVQDSEGNAKSGELTPVGLDKLQEADKSKAEYDEYGIEIRHDGDRFHLCTEEEVMIKSMTETNNWKKNHRLNRRWGEEIQNDKIRTIRRSDSKEKRSRK
jgi:hypothetical protein